MTITTIIFDFGGVITTSPFDAFNRFEAERGYLKNVIRRVNATNPNNNAWALFERNEIDAAQFDEMFAAEAAARKHAIRGADVLALLSGDIRPRVVDTLDILKAKGFALGCITNNVQTGNGAGMARSSDKAEAVAAIMARFDHVIESSKAGIRKPDPRIYAMMCEALGVSPEQCVYLDDLGINCKPAAAMGMIAIKVETEDQALADLDHALGGALTA
jgi:putative hydrolase of the HAD superfamily